MKRYFLVILLLLLNGCVESAPQKTELPKVHIVKRAPQEKLEHVIEKLKKQSEEDEKLWFVSKLSSYNGYIIDINNDGKLEYVFVYEDGSMHCLNFIVFTENANGLCELKIPREIGWFANAFDVDNKKTSDEVLFVAVDGKNYICTTNDSLRRTRDVQIWKDGKLTHACDAFWIKQQREAFNNLLKMSCYSDAYVFLAQFERNCRHLIDPQTDLWLRNDLALAALKDNCPKTSLKIIDELVNDTAYAHASSALKKAVEYNQEKSSDMLADDCTKGKADYNWVLANAKNSGEMIFAFDEFDKLLNNVVPDIKPLYFQNGHNDNTPLKDTMKCYFSSQMYGGKEVISERYVVCTGAVEHCNTSRALLWCDAKEKVSALVSVPDYRTNDNLMITSRSLEHNELPQEFYKTVKDWLVSCRKDNEEENDDKKIAQHKDDNLMALFYDRAGKAHPVRL